MGESWNIIEDEVKTHKVFAQGEYLIGDQQINGASEFECERILSGPKKFPDAPSVITHLGVQLNST